MNMKKLLVAAAAAVALTGYCAGPDCRGKCGPGGAPMEGCLVGSWGMYLPYDTMSAGHMIVKPGEDGKLACTMLLRWASPEKCKLVEVNGPEFRILGPAMKEIRGRVCGNLALCTIVEVDGKGKPKGEPKAFKCVRNPPIRPAKVADAKFGEKIDILKDGLEGFEAMGKGDFGWTFKDGVLSNRVKKNDQGNWVGHGVNIVTKRADFYDFKLSYDVRVPKNANSGMYLRGRYEIQTLDSFGKKVDCHNMAAFYGRITPSVAAEKPAGEWQHVDVTLFRRHVTVVLNGTTIIDNAPVEGVTGGAIDANEFVPGPLYIQGDHSDADYKNIYLYPAI